MAWAAAVAAGSHLRRGGSGGAGGSGVVVVRYLGDPLYIGGSVTAGIGAAAGYTLHTFSTVGSDTLTLAAGAGATLAGTLTGSGGFTWDADATLTLAGSNDYSGGTVVAAGRLIGTSASLQGGITNNAVVEFAQGTVGEYAGTMTGSGAVAKSDAGTVTLSGANTFSGGTTISAGTLAVAAIADTGTSNLGTTGTLTLAGGTLDYTGSTAATTARVVDISNSNTTSTINVSDATGSLAPTGRVRNTDPTHPNVVLTKTGLGTLEIAGAGSNTNTSLVAAAGTTVLNATTRAVYEIRALDTGATVRLDRPIRSSAATPFQLRATSE